MMKNRKKKILYGWVAMLWFVAGAVSCTDSEEHYKIPEEVAGRTSLWELISQQPELSTFASLLERYSYSRILSSEPVYTVWAPTNEYLTGVDPNDSVAVARVITTHIARYSYPASGAASKHPEIYMLNAKKQTFLSAGDTYTMGGVELLTKNMVAKNGILHTLKGQIPFFPNTWQMMEEARFDSIRSYLYSFGKREFVRGLSRQIDINEEGMIVYDSVFTERNTMWYVYATSKGIGWLNHEDSVYTMVLPDNAAWTETYNKYYPLFRPDPLLPNPDSVQRANTQYAIVQDLVFRGEIRNPAQNGVNDSIVSTRGAVIKNPARIFNGSSPVRTSNGWVYPVSELQYKRNDSYVKTIKIEAEMPFGRMHDESRDGGIIQTWYASDNPDISNKSFLRVIDHGKSNSEEPTVSFEIPGVVNTEYDIYAVFLSPSFVNPASLDTAVTRVKFEIQQWNRIGSKLDDNYWGNGKAWGPGKVLATFSGTGPEFVTQKRGVSVIKAGTFHFPFANINEEENVFRIKVISAITSRDKNNKENKFNKEMRIDYLLLIPSDSN
ncbi:MAG: fasciclin domain-containing protein [Dysgonamonadaceae bacterium]|jgi:uncharacterized surface protein with fasciclin (FAS1) repeats|nr:fasciclin domain-containing protein [Dysgonamonadaceae bacterium]